MVDIISSQFIGQSLHFGVNLIAALACLAAGWLFLDAWVERRHLSELAKGGSFLLIATGFLLNGATWGDAGLVGLIAAALKLTGYAGIIGCNMALPLQPRPKTTGYTPASALIATGVTTTITALLPIAALIASFFYWRLSTRGLERHLKPLALTFLIFAIADALALTGLWSTGSNPILQPLAAPFGLFWWLEHAAIITGSGILAHWVWRYLTKRVLSQLFLIITSLTFAVVLVATTSVSALLLSSLQHDALSSLETASKVLSYAIDSKTADTRASAEVLAKDPATTLAASTRDHTVLTKLAAALLVDKQLSEVVVTDEAGLVLSRASDPDRTGDSLSDSPLVQRGLIGLTAASITAHSGTLTPSLVITTASPVKFQDQIVGVALTSLSLDNTFVDGLKHQTGLDSTIFSGATRASTTLTGPDGVSRSLGAKETHTQIIDTTIKHGQIWKGIIDVSNQPYLSVYLPLKDINNSVVGMLFVGQPQDTVLSSAKHAVKITFLGASLTLLVITLPIFALSRQISRQLH